LVRCWVRADNPRPHRKPNLRLGPDLFPSYDPVSFRDQIADHGPLTLHVQRAKRAVHRLYRATGNADWVTAQTAILGALTALNGAFEYIEELAE
jgi:hypothetical protein